MMGNKDTILYDLDNLGVVDFTMSDDKKWCTVEDFMDGGNHLALNKKDILRLGAEIIALAEGMKE